MQFDCFDRWFVLCVQYTMRRGQSFGKQFALTVLLYNVMMNNNCLDNDYSMESLLLWFKPLFKEYRHNALSKGEI